MHSFEIHLVGLVPCWQIAPWTMVTESNMVNDSSLFFLNCFVVRVKNTISTVNPKNVKNVTIQTSYLNGRMQILCTLDSGGCLNMAAGLQNIIIIYQVLLRYCPIFES